MLLRKKLRFGFEFTSRYRGEGLGLDCSQQNLFVQAFIWHTSLCFLSPQQREITMSASTYFTGPIEQRLSDDLHLAGVAERTRKGYLRAVRQLAEHAKCSPDKMDEEQLRQWLLHLKVDKQFAYGSLRVAFSGVKFFFTRTCKRDWKTLTDTKLQNVKSLPEVLSIDQVHRLIDACNTQTVWGQPQS